MLIGQIVRKEIIRNSYDPSGKLLERQIIKTGNPLDFGTEFNLTANVTVYSGDGTLKNEFTTSFRCKTLQSDMILTVLPFADPAKEKITVRASANDFKSIYDGAEDNILQNISLEMEVENVILGFLGSRNTIFLANRTISANDLGKIVSENLTIKAYFLGLNVKTIEYTVRNQLTRDFQLIKQEFKGKDGSYFTMEYFASESLIK